MLGTTAVARTGGMKIREEASRELCISLYVRMFMPCAKMAMGDCTAFDRSSEHANTKAHGAYEPRDNAANI